MSCYYTTTEQEWGTSPSACGTITIRGVTYSGTVTGPPNLTGTYCNAFIAQTKLQGSGVKADGTKIQYLPDRTTRVWALNSVTEISTKDGTPPVADQTVARDRSIIGGKSSVRVSLDGIGSSLLANDIGGSGTIAGYRTDIYKGVGPGVCANYPNPIVVGACSPGSATCPASVLQ